MKKCALIAMIAFIMCSCSNNRIRCGEYEATVTEYSEYTHIDEYGEKKTESQVRKPNRTITISIYEDESKKHDFLLFIDDPHRYKVITYADLTKNGLDIGDDTSIGDDWYENHHVEFVKSHKDTLWLSNIFTSKTEYNHLVMYIEYVAIKK